MIQFYGTFLKFKRRRTCLKDEGSRGQVTTEVKEENMSDAEIMARLFAILHGKFQGRKI